MATTMSQSLEAHAPADVYSMTDDALAQKYGFVQEIGVGNWGSVWLGTDKDAPSSKQRVAIKVVHRSKTQTTAARVRSLWNEMKIIRPLKAEAHSSIISFDCFIITPSYALIAMEYLPQLIPVEVDERRAKNWFASLTSAVDFLHSRGVVHNDIKPANILLTDASVPKLVDFGFAERYDMSSPTAFQSPLAYGTPEYLSPERARGLPHDTRKSDVWSLAITFFEILTGRTPFERDGEKFSSKEELETYWSRTAKGKWLGLSSERAKGRISYAVESLLRAMLCPNADLRITAREAIQDLYWKTPYARPMAEPETPIKAKLSLRRSSRSPPKASPSPRSVLGDKFQVQNTPSSKARREPLGTPKDLKTPQSIRKAQVPMASRRKENAPPSAFRGMANKVVTRKPVEGVFSTPIEITDVVDQDEIPSPEVPREAKSSLPVVQQAQKAEQVAADNRADRMSLWIKQVERVVEEAKNNFAKNSTQPLPPVPRLIGPSNSRRRADKIFAPLLDPSLSSPVRSTSPESILQPASRRGSIDTYEANPSIQRRATTSVNSAIRSGRPSLEETRRVRSEIFLSGSISARRNSNTPWDRKDELKKLSDVIDPEERQMFFSHSTLPRDTILARPTTPDLKVNVIEPTPQKPVKTGKIEVVKESANESVIDGESFYDRFLMFKRINRAYHSQPLDASALERPASAPSETELKSKKSMTRFFYSTRGRKQAEQVEPKTQRNVVSFEDFARSRNGPPSLAGSIRASGVDATPEPQPVKGKNLTVGKAGGKRLSVRKALLAIF